MKKPAAKRKAKKATRKHPGGRPTLYTRALCGAAEELIRSGLGEYATAEKLGICGETWRSWKHKHPEFSAAIARAQEPRVEAVECSLYKTAMGYEVSDERMNSEGELVSVTRHVPGDFRAQSFILRNKRPGEWRERQEVEHSGSMTFAGLVRELAALEIERPAGGVTVHGNRAVRR